MPTSHYGPGVDRHSLNLAAVAISQISQLFVITLIILLFFWLLRIRGGLNFLADDPERIFNVHAFLMVFGFILPNGEAIITYKLTAGPRPTRRRIHMIVNLIAFCLGIVGIGAAIKYHNMENVGLGHLDSLHSWIGISTMSMFIVQWSFGLYNFVIGKSTSEREKNIPFHVLFGIVVFYMGITAALSGLAEKASLLRLKHQQESRVINSIGLFVMTFGFCVALAVELARRQY